MSAETSTRTPADVATTRAASKHESELVAVAAAAVELSKALGGEPDRQGGSLTVVGTGIRAIAQLTVETLAAMSEAEALVHVIGEPIQEEALATINPLAETLTGYYVEGMERSSTYEAIINHVLGEVMAGKRTVAAFYGHPGVFTYPSHESVRRARAAGFPARMLPAVSSEDCLFADLGIDPGDGCQSYEATDFIFSDRPFTPTAHLVLWQVGTLGNWTYESAGYDLSSFPALVQKLLTAYPPHHPVTIYEAPFHPTGDARSIRLPIVQIHGSQMTPATTLHIPPLPARSPWGW